MKIIPLFDRVVVKEIKEKENQKGNIIIPDAYQPAPIYSEVVSIGTGGKIDGDEINFQVKIGDRVLFNKYSSSEFKIENETFSIIKQCDILAIINKGEEE